MNESVENTRDYDNLLIFITICKYIRNKKNSLKTKFSV